MKFCVQLAPYLPDKTYGGHQVFDDVLQQAITADKAGFESVSVTEHHLMNILMMPAPLQFAIQIAARTEQVKILPLLRCCLCTICVFSQARLPVQIYLPKGA